MMSSHIYYTLQSLLHRQGTNAIKIVSLALGLLMSVFLFARIAFELNFDSFYHDPDNLSQRDDCRNGKDGQPDCL